MLNFAAEAEFNANETFTADEAVTESSGFVLPAMKNAEFEVVDISDMRWDDGGITLNFSVEVKNDNADGSLNGRKGRVSFQIKGFRSQEEKEGHEKRFKAFHAACGFSSLQLADLSVFQLKTFRSDVGIYKNKNTGKESNNFFYKKPQGGMSVPQSGGFQPQAPQQHTQGFQSQPQAQQGFQPQAANVNQQQMQQAPQGMPNFTN